MTDAEKVREALKWYGADVANEPRPAVEGLAALDSILADLEAARSRVDEEQDRAMGLLTELAEAKTRLQACQDSSPTHMSPGWVERWAYEHMKERAEWEKQRADALRATADAGWESEKAAEARIQKLEAALRDIANTDPRWAGSRFIGIARRALAGDEA